MPNDRTDQDQPRNPDQQTDIPQRTPSGDRSAQERGDKGSLGGDQPTGGRNEDIEDQPLRNPNQGSRDFEK